VRLGLSVYEFYCMTPREFSKALKEYSENQLEEYKRVHEAIRFQEWININHQLQKKDRYKIPRDMLEFEWETPKVQTVQEMKYMLQSIVAHAKQKNKHLKKE